ncbi:hypothetical protein Y1Q_0014817 [Alligator mississippiensis]|uniref:Uncharacterized protein n=1 Tax=Alligator mississippiensis TaxID=8496 RepID=A0A151M216_ALLMI|nr:hypothetical protein Y1Q_0014817 [Alligator mississippiensis]
MGGELYANLPGSAPALEGDSSPYFSPPPKRHILPVDRKRAGNAGEDSSTETNIEVCTTPIKKPATSERHGFSRETEARVASVSMGLGEETLAQEQRDGYIYHTVTAVTADIPQEVEPETQSHGEACTARSCDRGTHA